MAEVREGSASPDRPALFLAGTAALLIGVALACWTDGGLAEVAWIALLAVGSLLMSAFILTVVVADT